MSTLKEIDDLRIGIEEIKAATKNFSAENLVGLGAYGKMYKGELVLRPEPEGSVKVKQLVAVKRLNNTTGQGSTEFWKEITVLSRYKHENIVSLVGFCEESGEKIVVYEFHNRQSLDRYLSKPDLTWLMRLRICLGVARGLSYLHHPQGTQRVIHRDIKSTNILLDESWDAKITGFGLSMNLLHSFLVTNPVGTFGYVDPLYIQTGRLREATDLYSFGVVLFELLCGRLAVKIDDDDERRFLAPFVCRHYEQGTIIKIMDPILTKQMHPDMLTMFSQVAYQCLNKDPEERPKMVEVVKKLEQLLGLQQEFEKALAVQEIDGLEHLQIPLDDIRKATNNFHVKNLIGVGGFGGVYEAELFHFDVRKYVVNNESHDPSMTQHTLRKVAVKRLDRRYGQGKEQFLQEVKVLSRLHHQNLVPLLGFCNEDNEMILVYEHAPNGSLDKHIKNTRSVYSHTWAQRLQICIDVAHGLSYLHDNNIIHRDIKTANILLGRNLEGMIGDFGLSRISKHADHEFTLTNVAGTVAYVDPSYARTGKLSKRSDIYSFGVVLLEVLCGRLAVVPKFWDDPEYLLHMFKRHFEQKMTLQSVDRCLVEEFEKDYSSIPENSLNSIYAFADITYKCLYDNQAQNLTMREVITELVRSQTFHVNATEFFVSDALQSAQAEEPPSDSIEKVQTLGTKEKTITVYATYREDIISFVVGSKLGIATLKEEVAKRLKLDVGTFDMTYLDDDYEYSVLHCDADLQECVELSLSSGSNIIRLLVITV